MAKYAEIDEAKAKKILKKIDKEMDNLRALVGKKGDGKTNRKTLIGAVEYMNDQAYGGQKLNKAYNEFNSKTLPTFKNQVYAMDFEFNVIDRLNR